MLRKLDGICFFPFLSVHFFSSVSTYRHACRLYFAGPRWGMILWVNLPVLLDSQSVRRLLDVAVLLADLIIC